MRGAGGSCHAAALPLLSAHPAERGEKRALGVVGARRMGLGQEGIAAPQEAPRFPEPWDRGNGERGWGSPPVHPETKLPGCALRGFNEVQQLWEAPANPGGWGWDRTPLGTAAHIPLPSPS